MSALPKLGAFALALALLLGVGALAGDAIGADPARTADAAGSHPEPADDEHAETAPASHANATAAGHPVRGLAVAENGLRLVVDDPDLRRGRTERLAFRVVDDAGETVRDFDVEHEKRMHLIVARRDLTGFQHLHPAQAADGTWTVPVRVVEAGSYRLFADFARDGVSHTLASDLRVDGVADLRPLPAPRATAVSDGGYDVHLAAERALPGREAELRFTITKNGRSVHTQPYLGAGGHLVALRDGDLAFLHVHPTERADEDEARRDDSVGFAATFPTAGRYRLFLQFKHEGRVRTVAFTHEVGQP